MSAKMFLKLKFKQVMKSKTVIVCISYIIYLYSKLAGLTCRWKCVGVDEVKEKIKDTNVIFVGWHSRATMMPFFQDKFLKRNMAALVSPHQDGQLIANLLKCYGITPINGSSNENQRQSALGLMRALLNGYDVFISPDGPRGPRMRMKKSPIYYAQKTGKPIVCACYSNNPAVIMSSAWDKTMVTLPFSKGVMCLSEPLYVPENITEEEFEQYRQKLENIANEQSQECDRLVGRTPILPADMDDFKRKG